MKRIAMRCNKEQFDSIKDRIKNIDSIFDFKKYPYLVTNRNGGNYVSNIARINKNRFNRRVYEYWDENIFLKACGVEIEKVWNSSEMQFRSFLTGEWCDYESDFKIRVKPKNNYDKEVEALQNKAKENGMKVIIKFEEL